MVLIAVLLPVRNFMLLCAKLLRTVVCALKLSTKSRNNGRKPVIMMMINR